MAQWGVMAVAKLKRLEALLLKGRGEAAAGLKSTVWLLGLVPVFMVCPAHSSSPLTCTFLLFNQLNLETWVEAGFKGTGTQGHRWGEHRVDNVY